MRQRSLTWVRSPRVHQKAKYTPGRFLRGTKLTQSTSGPNMLLLGCLAVPLGRLGRILCHTLAVFKHCIIPDVYCAAAFPCSADLRNHLAASTLSSATPRPFASATPKLYLALTCPCLAALRYHLAVSASSFATPSPFASATLKLHCALTCPCSGALR
eukprot:CAMPEP_0171843740 /NCGR_PEP_ID=MMETSP0992-20121227/16046_1 /TAXON_ID=483369 /ORGANISM="non described non described, Strain CCMP2098" /LENGTH=157 /DNA_ID=CAMNT_0012461387 /DNA_START=200 /DNA_END=673 /DNA_ORIENTATION=+